MNRLDARVRGSFDAQPPAGVMYANHLMSFRVWVAGLVHEALGESPPCETTIVVDPAVAAMLDWGPGFWRLEDVDAVTRLAHRVLGAPVCGPCCKPKEVGLLLGHYRVFVDLCADEASGEVRATADGLPVAVFNVLNTLGPELDRQVRGGGDE